MSIILKYRYNLVYKNSTIKIDNNTYFRLHYRYKLPSITNPKIS